MPFINISLAETGGIWSNSIRCATVIPEVMGYWDASRGLWAANVAKSLKSMVAFTIHLHENNYSSMIILFANHTMKCSIAQLSEWIKERFFDEHSAS
jgi:hypothetical protein